MDARRLPSKLRRAKRCAHKVDRWHDGDLHRCANYAIYEVDGVDLCATHAGRVAISHLIKQTNLKKLRT